jgi:hypothetical protein
VHVQVAPTLKAYNVLHKNLKPTDKGINNNNMDKMDITDLDDPSCISFSENIDESPNRMAVG